MATQTTEAVQTENVDPTVTLTAQSFPERPAEAVILSEDKAQKPTEQIVEQPAKPATETPTGNTLEISSPKPKIRRILDEEGGTTTASVCRTNYCCHIGCFKSNRIDTFTVSSLPAYLGSWREVSPMAALRSH